MGLKQKKKTVQKARPSASTSTAGVKPASTSQRFFLDCSQAVHDNIVDMRRTEKFLRDHIKVDGKVGQLADKIEVSVDKSKIHIKADARFPKRYLKYLTKKYLKKQQLRDFMRVVATSKAGYELRYFAIN